MEQAGETPAGHAKRQRLVLDRGTSRQDPSRSCEATKACPRLRNKRARPQLVKQSNKGFSSTKEHASETPVGHVKRHRAFSRLRNKRARPQQNIRNSKGLFLTEEQTDVTPTGHMKQQWLVLNRGTSGRDPSRSREAAKACPRSRDMWARPRHVTRSSNDMSSNEK